MQPSHRRQLLIAAAAMLVMVLAAARLPVNAQDAKPPDKEEAKAIDFWKTNAGVEVQAAMVMFGEGNVRGALVARMLLSDHPFLKAIDPGVNGVKWQFEFDEPLPLPRYWLMRIKDRQPLPDVRGTNLKGDEDLAWYYAFSKALQYSSRDDMDLDKFKKGAEPNLRVLSVHLTKQPEEHRGKIITVRGELLVVREEAPPRRAGADLKNIYTAYIAGPTQGASPFAVAFTELPQEIKDMPRHQWEKPNLEVTFHGYFLSLIRFPADKGSKSRDDVISPYLVGRSLIVEGKAKTTAPPIVEMSYSYSLIVSALAGILAVVLLGAALNVWLRRGDRRTQARLAQVRDRHNPFNLEPAEPEPQSDGIKPVDGE
jgi:hypothetical protein